jgi:hypothetical protein
MKKSVGILFYTASIIVLSFFLPFQWSILSFSSSGSLVDSIHSKTADDSNSLFFIANVEEVEISEECDSDASGPSGWSRLNDTNSSLIKGNFINFLQSAVVFVTKERLYIFYSSLKLPF